jgi:hypothetical protein
MFCARIVTLAAVALALTHALSGNVMAQSGSVPTRRLMQPEVELSEPFSRLMGVRELADGRIVVSDMTEKLIAIVDLSRKSITRIGHEGQGPGEYTLPGAIAALPGDSTLVSDMLAGKYLKIAPNGTIAGDVRIGNDQAGGGIVRVGAGLTSQVDALGRIYTTGSPIAVDPGGGITTVDSIPVLRHDLRNNRVDSMAWVPSPQVRVQNSPAAAAPGAVSSRGGNVNMSVRMGSATPFVVTPAWLVAPDGRIALVTPEPYRVAWVSPTKQRTSGQPIPYDRVRVNEAEKQAYREQLTNSPPTTLSVTRDNNGPARYATGAGQFREPDSWPDYKHPYATGAGALVVAPTGDLWIQKLMPASVRNPTFDVIGARGELTGRIVLPENTRVLGFGRAGAIYLVRRDADDLEYVQRYRISAAR